MVGVSFVPNLQLWWLLACSYHYKKTTLHFDSKTGPKASTLITNMYTIRI